jgi:hypothetical protein
MMRMKFVLPVVAIAVLGGSAARAETNQMPMVTVHSETTITAPPSVVWTYITTGKNFAAWNPNWRAAKNAKINITRMGDILEYIDASGNGGRSLVTYCVMNRELRVAHEPMKGDYVGHAKFLLSAGGGGTTLGFWNSYTDSSEAKNFAATMEKMQNAADKSLAAIKQGIENPVQTPAKPASTSK